MNNTLTSYGRKSMDGESFQHEFCELKEEFKDMLDNNMQTRSKAVLWSVLQAKH